MNKLSSHRVTSIARGVAITLAILFSITLASAKLPPFFLRHSMLMPSDLQSNARLGVSSAMSGNFIALGASTDDQAAINAGVVKVFDATTGALLHTLTAPSPEQQANFGSAVVMQGALLAVGAASDDTGATNSGRVFLYDLSSATPTLPTLIIGNPAPGNNDGFGNALALSGNRLVVGASGDNAIASGAGSVYVFDLNSATPAMPEFAFSNPSPAVADRFGYAVAIDGATLVVGAAFDDMSGENRGAAYVYNLGVTKPALSVLMLSLPAGGNSDARFGSAVAVSVSTVVVGADGENYGAPVNGRTYVYDLSSGTPSAPVHTLNNPNATFNSNFGGAVALSGTRLIVGAVGYGITNAVGTVHVYDLSGATPTAPVRTLNNPTPAGQDYFGISLALSGDRVLVGASQDDTGAVNAGSGYLYNLISATPTTPVLTFNHSGQDVESISGQSVTVAGKWMAVGAPSDDLEIGNAGTVRVYDLTSATPTVPVYTLAKPEPTGSNDTNFGGAVALSGNRLVVGARFAAVSGVMFAGSVYVYDLAGATPSTPILTIHNPPPVSNDEFGRSVAISGTRIVVGAPADDPGASNAGSAYVYDLTSGTPSTPILTLPHPAPLASDEFGGSVAISGDRVIVGAINGDTGAVNSGNAYVFNLASGTPTVPEAPLIVPNPASSISFGSSVAIHGSLAVVGVPRQQVSIVGTAGVVHCYDLASAQPDTAFLTLENPFPSVNANFGTAVSVSGSRILVGASRDDTGDTDSGASYVYDVTSATPTAPLVKLANPGAGAGDEFGTAVCIDGDRAVVGAPLSDVSGRNQGVAYVFETPSADANLASLALSIGSLSPTFDANTTTYTATISAGTSSLTVTPTEAHVGAIITVNGNIVESGNASGTILEMSEKTAKQHLGTRFQKMGVESRNAATVMALEALSAR